MVEDNLIDRLVAAEWLPDGSAVLSLLSVVSGPILIALMLMFYWARRGRARIPALIPAVPLSLTSVSIQIVVTSLVVIRSFQDIAASGSSGPSAIASSFAGVEDALMWRVMGVSACVAVATAFQILVQRHSVQPQNESAETSQDSVSAGAISWSAAAAIGVALLVWYGAETVRIIMLLVDPAPSADAQAIFGNMGIGAISAMVSTRLTLLALAGITLTWMLIAIGLRCMEAGRPKRWDAVISGALAVAVLGWTAASTSSIRTDVRSLRKFAEAPAATIQVPPDFSVLPGDTASPGSTSTRENFFEGLPPPPPPPPPPPSSETGPKR